MSTPKDAPLLKVRLRYTRPGGGPLTLRMRNYGAFAVEAAQCLADTFRTSVVIHATDARRFTVIRRVIRPKAP